MSSGAMVFARCRGKGAGFSDEIETTCGFDRTYGDREVVRARGSQMRLKLDRRGITMKNIPEW